MMRRYLAGDVDAFVFGASNQIDLIFAADVANVNVFARKMTGHDTRRYRAPFRMTQDWSISRSRPVFHVLNQRIQIVQPQRAEGLIEGHLQARNLRSK